VFITNWDQQYNCEWQNNYNKTYFINNSDYKATKCIDFSELKLENEMKEIIGYKLIAPEYKEAALSICNTVANWENSLKKYDIKINQIGYINKLEKAGVLNLWFEPVYAPQYKIGDFVIWKKETSQQNVYKICGISDNGYDLEWEGRNVFYGKENIPFRKATEKEIADRLSKTLILGSTKIEIVISKSLIKADGKSFNISDLINLTTNMKGYDSMGYYLKFSNVTIGCCTFTLQELESIITEYNKLNGSN